MQFRNWPKLGPLSLFGFSGLALATACSALTNTTAIQCTSESECLTLGPAFVGTTCDVVSKTCVRTSTTASNCERNQECITRAGGQAAICRKSDNRCVTLTTPECPTIVAKNGVATLADDNVVIIGAMLPDGHTELGTVMERSAELAVSEISNSTFGGLPPRPNQTAPRPFALVACREFASGREGVIRAATHLADVVQVPAVIGPIDGSNQSLAMTQVFLPRRVLTLLPASQVSATSTLPNPIAPTSLIWKFGPDDRTFAKLTAAFLKDKLEPAIRARGDAVTRVAIVSSSDFLGISGVEQLLKRLSFNDGKSAAENQAANAFVSISIGNPDDPIGNPSPEGRISQAVAQAVAFQPNVIIHMYPPSSITRVYIPLEGALSAAGGRPYHVGTVTWNAFSPVFPFIGGGGPAVNRAARTFSLNSFVDLTGKSPPFPASSPNLTAWFARFADKNQDLAASPARFAVNAQACYDAAYTLAYAIVALRDKPISGENLASMLLMLRAPGVPVNTYDGPSVGYSTAVGELISGRGIDLQGLSGNLDFDETGAQNYSSEMTCPNVVNGQVAGFRGSGFRYRPSGDTFVITSADGTDRPTTEALINCVNP
jgi:hypothetical protein